MGLWFVFGVSSIYCFLYRAYVIWYEINRQLALQNRDWRKQINKREVNWFLDPINRRKFGNYRRIGAICSVMVVLSAIPTTVLVLTATEYDGAYNRQSRIFMMLFTSLPAVLIAVICKKTPVLEDAFYIQKELQMFCRIGFATVCYQVLYTIILSPEPGSW